jgi:hypothetical protein
LDVIVHYLWKFTEWIASWNSSDWAALGQWLGAVATFLAVRVSLKLARESGSPKVRVESSFGFLGSNLPPYTSEPMLFFKAVNVGPIDVTLESSYIRLPRGFADAIRREPRKNMWLIGHYEKAVPAKLSPAESTQYFIPARKLATSLKDQGFSGTVKIAIVFTDTFGNRYEQPFKFSIESWEK